MLIKVLNIVQHLIIASVASNPCLRVKGPDKQIQSGCSKKKFFAIYFSHLPVVSYKSFGLRKKIRSVIGIFEKIGNFLST
jgi:hypothetical protein